MTRQYFVPVLATAGWAAVIAMMAAGTMGPSPPEPGPVYTVACNASIDAPAGTGRTTYDDAYQVRFRNASDYVGNVFGFQASFYTGSGRKLGSVIVRLPGNNVIRPHRTRTWSRMSPRLAGYTYLTAGGIAPAPDVTCRVTEFADNPYAAGWLGHEKT